MPDPLSVCQGAARIREGRLQSTAWTDDCLSRIGRLDERLRAWVVVDEAGARRTAAMRDEEAARGAFRGPLHGVPLGVKDIIDVAGLPTRAGSPLRTNHVAKEDAPLVAQLREAGAVVLGKTVTVEFACFDPSPSRNPWDPDLRRTPGGSSSGSAVAVASGMCPAAIGTQTGGSLVRPAAYCGVATLKPTFGRVSTQGIVPVSFHLDYPGPMARQVDDLAVLWQCLGQGGPARPEGDAGKGLPLEFTLQRANEARAESGTLKRELQPPDRMAATRPFLHLSEGRRAAETPGDACHVRPPRLGQVEVFARHADALVTEAVEAALAKLREGGATILPVGFPEPLERIQAQHRRIMAVEAAAYHRHSFAAHREQYGPMITGLLDEGLKILGIDYSDALAWQRQFSLGVSDSLSGVEALLAPSIDTTAPPTLETTGSNLFQAPFSCAGLPVVSLPCGLASDGMPVAVQLVGRSNSEDNLLALARWCERQFGFATQNMCPAI